MSGSSKQPEKEIYKLLTARYPAEPVWLLAALEEVQTQMGWVPEGLGRDLAGALKAGPEQLETLFSVEGLFRLEPPVAHAIEVCCGAVCSTRGGEVLLAELQQRAEGTDVRVERAPSCVGCCDRPPAVLYNGEVFPGATSDGVWQAVTAAD